MKTIHVSLSVENLENSIGYYGALFGRGPDVIKPRFAKWWLEDPRLNFALNESDSASGLHHLGIQTDEQQELETLYENAKEAGSFAEEGDTTCCYARSEKGWSHDPQNIAWELFLTRERIHDRVETPESQRLTPCC